MSLLSGRSGQGARRWVGPGVGVHPLPAPLVFLPVGRVHEPGGVPPTAGGAVQVGGNLASGANFRGGLCRAHRLIGYHPSIVTQVTSNVSPSEGLSDLQRQFN